MPLDFSSFPTDDPRLGHWIQTFETFQDVPLAPKPRQSIALIGFPWDEGVARNKGRIGAKLGPETAFQYIAKVGTLVNCEYNVDLRENVFIVNVGLIQTAKTLEEGHQQLTECVQHVLRKGYIPFVIGGGNDQSYPNAKGWLNNLAATTTPVVVNIDAHLDVRPLNNGKVHSGSPFRLLLEDSAFQQRHGRFVEFASQGSQCSALHVEYLLSRNRFDASVSPAVQTSTEIVWLRQLRPDLQVSLRHTVQLWKESLLKRVAEDHSVFISFDLDAVCGADAPGVSCASPSGLTAEEALHICFEAGRMEKVSIMDLSEYNPVIEEYRTGRLVATMFYYFCLGVASRG